MVAGTSPGVWDRPMQKVALAYDSQHQRKLMLLFTNKTK